MTDRELINSINSDLVFLKQKCENCMELRGGLPNAWNPYAFSLPLINEYSQTVTTTCDRSVASSTIILKCVNGKPKMNGEVIDMNENYRIRKLTPYEYWKLMGMTAEDCKTASEAGVSDSQLYHQAGNGLVTNCVQEIFEHLYKAEVDGNFKCTDENFQ